MYFSADAFNRYYALLAGGEGKTNIERTSSLMYFLAVDKVQKEFGSDIIKLYKDSPHRASFQSFAAETFVLGETEVSEYQANYLGQITIENKRDTMAVKVGKNFLSTQVNRASGLTDPLLYPLRPPASYLLMLGMDTDAGKWGATKYNNWQENLMTFIEFRACGTDTLPLIVFLLKNYNFSVNSDMMDELRQALLETYTDQLVTFLMNHASTLRNDPSLFSEQMWTIDQLDPTLIRGAEEKVVAQPAQTEGTAYAEVEITLEIPRNRIIYGAPGTGKSHKLSVDAETYFPSSDLYTRITFHPNYSYGQFVGTYKPVPIYRRSSDEFVAADRATTVEGLEPVIDYQFVGGPFLETLVKAIQNPNSNFLILIEEINRANAAAVFGDTFQLLDRDEFGAGEYSITFNPDAMAYLRSKGIFDSQITLPANMFIWATMNSADQGVTPLDTAFKRRFSFEYLPLNENEDEVADREITLPFLDNPITWNKFRSVINNKLKDLNIAEDKLIGPFFLKPHELENAALFKNKFLLYLRDDVLRHHAHKFFAQSTFSDIVAAYDRGENIFKFDESEFLG